MKITTKYNIGDNVYFVNDNRICSGKIHKIVVRKDRVIVKKDVSLGEIYGNKTNISYKISSYTFMFNENKVYSNIDELLKDL